jgi:hypothetical protein
VTEPRRVQIGPTLWFQLTEPRVGDWIRTHDGERKIVEVTASPEDGGWLFTVESK